MGPESSEPLEVSGPEVTGVIVIGAVSLEDSKTGSGVTERPVVSVVSGLVKVTDIGTTGGIVAPEERLSVSMVGKVTGTFVVVRPSEFDSVTGMATTEGFDASEDDVSSGKFVMGILLTKVVSGLSIVVGCGDWMG